MVNDIKCGWYVAGMPNHHPVVNINIHFSLVWMAKNGNEEIMMRFSFVCI